MAWAFLRQLSLLPPTPNTAEPSFEESRIQAQLERGFPKLRFEPRLEDAYRDFLQRRLLRRVPFVSFTALTFFLIYSGLDSMLFPPSVSVWTISIRLGVVCPTVLLVAFAAWRQWPRDLFMQLYGGSYVVGGLAIVGIILTAHVQGVMMPYDGLFLVLMFGYFLMALPFYVAVTSSWLMYALYLGLELWVGVPLSILLYNTFFLFTANFIGSVGSYLQEHAQRTHFLNMLLIQASRQRAEEENRAKTKFLATASHDLRQPLHAMNLLVAHLSERLAGQSEGQIVAKLKQSIEQLNQLLRSLLDISKLNIGIVKPKYQHFQLPAFIQSIASDFQALAEEQSLRFTCNCPRSTVVYSDPVLLERMIRNLLSNAFSHSGASHIRLQVDTHAKSLLLRVMDDGKGISETEQEKIFMEFHQGHDERNNQRGGLGLGLAIVKHLALLMDYDFGVESAEGQGAVFWIKVPEGLNMAVTRLETGLPTDVLRGQRQRILLVENDQAALDAMASLLRSWGCQVTEASSSIEALQRLEEGPPDLLISDYRLGEGDDGLALAVKLRAQIAREVPAIIVTADTESGLAEQASDSVTLVAYKPLVPAQLQLMMRKLLSRETAMAV